MFSCPNCNAVLQGPGSGDDARACPACGEPVVHPEVDDEEFELETAEMSMDHGAPTVQPLAPAAPSMPSLPGFEVVRLIGVGGMGEVWEGRQTSLGGRRVAIKVLPGRLLQDQSAITRFRHEAEALASLSHANIVNVIDFQSTGEADNLIMEYVEGNSQSGQPEDLLHLIDAGELDSERTRELILQIADALAYAHEKGIVHRDVKPANVMIDAQGNAKVADFGLASISRTQASQRLTLEGQGMGTPAYMAPEQNYDAKWADPRADVFSAGVMLYEMLTGQLPRGSFRPPSQLVPGLDSGWDAVVDKAMRTEKEERYSSMREMAAEINRFTTETIAIAPVERQGAGEASAMSLPDHTCYSCRQPVAPNAQFCNECGASLRFACPRCGAETQGGIKFCPDCGIDVFKVSQFQEKLGQAEQEMQAAKVESLGVVEQLAHAKTCREYLTEAMKYVPEDAEAQALLRQANQLIAQLAVQAGETAYRDKRFSEAADCYACALEVQSDHPVAKKRMDEIARQRQKLLDKARELMREGSYEKTTKGLESALTQFTGDPEIESLLSECREQQSSKQDAKEKVRSLEQEKKLFALADFLTEQKRSGTIVKGMERFEKKLQEKLASFRTALAEARAEFNRGEHDEALERINWIQKHVSDYTEANDLVRQVTRKIEREAKRGAGWLLRLTFLLLFAAGVGFLAKDYWYQPKYATVNYWVTMVFPGGSDAGEDDGRGETRGNGGDLDGDLPEVAPTRPTVLDRYELGRIAFLGMHRYPVYGVAFTPNGNTAITASTRSDKASRVKWDLSTLNGTSPESWNYSDSLTLDISPDGKYVACYSYPKGRKPGISIFDLDGNLKNHLSEGKGIRCNLIRFSPDGNHILSASGDKQVRFWKDWKQTPNATTIKEYGEDVYAIAFTPDSKRCIVSSGYLSPFIDLFDASDTPGTMLQQFKGHANRVIGLAVTADGKRIVSVDADRYNKGSTIRTWDIRRKKLLITKDIRTQVCVAFSRDARFAVFGDNEGVVSVYDIEAGQSIASWETDGKNSIQSTAISYNGRFGLSGSHDGRVYYWGLPSEVHAD